MNAGDGPRNRKTENVEAESVSASGACMTFWFGLLILVVALRVFGVNFG